MTNAEIAHVIQPFSQLENSLTRRQEGTGLGLPLMVAFMKLHGGALKIKSDKGVGTTLTLVFPPARTIRQAI